MGKTTSQPTTYPSVRAVIGGRVLSPLLAALAAVALFGALAARAGSAAGVESAASAAAPAVLELVPSSATVRVGDRVTVELRGGDLPVFGGVGLYLHFDATRLQALPVLPGIHIMAGGLLTPTFREQENAVDNAGGLISYAASRGAEPYPSGAGCLIRFAFEAVATGDAPVTISTQETAIVSPDGLRLDYTATGVTLSVLPALTCVEGVANGGFEDASAQPWVLAGEAQISRGLSHSGAASAWLGGRDYSVGSPEDRLTQSLRIAQGTETATLRYWYRIQTEETGAAADRLTVELLDEAGVALAQQEWTNLDATEWRESSLAGLNLAPYAEQTLRLVLRSAGDATELTSFNVDDVSLEVCGLYQQPRPVYLPLVLRQFTASP